MCNVAIQSITPNTTNITNNIDVQNRGSCNDASTITLWLSNLDKEQKQIYNVTFIIIDTDVKFNVNISELLIVILHCFHFNASFKTVSGTFDIQNYSFKSESTIQINYLENSQAYGGLLIILNDDMRIQYFKVIQGAVGDLDMSSSSTKQTSYMYDINSSGYLDEGNISPSSSSIEAPDIVEEEGNTTKIIQVHYYYLFVLYSYLLEKHDMNCSIIDNHDFMRIECDCSLQNSAYQVILKSSRESSGNVIAVRAECENGTHIPVDPSLLYDIIIFQISIVNGKIQHEPLHYFQQSMSVLTTETASTNGSARKDNGTIIQLILLMLISIVIQLVS